MHILVLILAFIPVVFFAFFGFVAAYHTLMLRLVRGEDSTVAILFQPFSRLLSWIAFGFLWLVLVVVGYAVFVLPGVYLSLAFIFAPFLMMDKNAGVLEALALSESEFRRSWDSTCGLVLATVCILVAGPLLPTALIARVSPELGAVVLIATWVGSCAIAMGAFAFAYRDLFGVGQAPRPARE